MNLDRYLSVLVTVIACLLGVAIVLRVVTQQDPDATALLVLWAGLLFTVRVEP